MNTGTVPHGQVSLSALIEGVESRAVPGQHSTVGELQSRGYRMGGLGVPAAFLDVVRT